VGAILAIRKKVEQGVKGTAPGKKTRKSAGDEVVVSRKHPGQAGVWGRSREEAETENLTWQRQVGGTNRSQQKGATWF